MNYKNEGITLISVIVIIIVLLILAGVSVSTLTGSNGILQQVEEARKKMKKSEIIEEVQLQLLENKINDTDSSFIYELCNILKEYGSLKRDSNNEIILTTSKENIQINVKDINNDIRIAIPGITVTDETALFVDDNGETAIIPRNFVVSNINGEQKISDGLVIYQLDTSTIDNWFLDSDENNYLDIQETYNQFVWIPVPNVVYNRRNKNKSKNY